MIVELTTRDGRSCNLSVSLTRAGIKVWNELVDEAVRRSDENALIVLRANLQYESLYQGTSFPGLVGKLAAKLDAAIAHFQPQYRRTGAA